VFVKTLRDFVEYGFNEELGDHSCNREQRSVVFVGETGCGKSYVINSILRATMADEFEADDTEIIEFSQPDDARQVEVC